MLELIVLGWIPGTHLQITFAWCMVGLLACLIWLDVKIHQFIKSEKPRGKRVEIVRPRRA